MKVLMITADRLGSSDSVQIGVASSEEQVRDMVEQWLSDHQEVSVPAVCTLNDLRTVAEDEAGWYVSWNPHEVDSLNPLYT